MHNPMVDYRELRVEDSILADRNVRDEFKHLPTAEIKQLVEQNQLPFSVAALSITGDLNLGAFLRSAHLMGAKEAFVIGRRKLDRRSLVGMQNYMTIHRIEGRNDDMMSINPDVVHEVFTEHNLMPVVIELNGTPLSEMNWHQILDKPVAFPCLIIGNEGRGIGDDVLDMLRTLPGHVQVSIPQRGAGRSHNVSIAGSIVMAHMIDQMGWW